MYAHRSLPEEYWTEGWAFNVNAMNLSIQARWFVTACALFGFCEENGAQPGSVFFDWQFTAARDAIVALYNYREAMDGCQANLRKIRAWSKLVDHAAIERARERFKREFPGIRELRTTVVHAVEIFRNEQLMKQNVKSGNIVEGGNLSGATYSAVFGGVSYTLDLTTDKVRALNAITSAILQALSAIPHRQVPGWPHV